MAGRVLGTCCSYEFNGTRRLGEGRQAVIAAQVPIDKDGPALTACEVQLVRLVAQGHSIRRIAELLELPSETVERCRASAMRKIGTDCTAGLTSFAVRHGLAGP